MAHKDEELTERLVDFDHHGIDYQSRVDLRMQSWEAIRRLRAIDPHFTRRPRAA